MHIEFIYTFEDRLQKIMSYPFVFPIMKNKRTFIQFATTDLSDIERKTLVKISSCVYLTGEKDLSSQWFDSCDGKLYFKNGSLIR